MIYSLLSHACRVCFSRDGGSVFAIPTYLIHVFMVSFPLESLFPSISQSFSLDILKSQVVICMIDWKRATCSNRRCPYLSQWIRSEAKGALRIRAVVLSQLAGLVGLGTVVSRGSKQVLRD
jgi:hypothetical protein